MNVLNDSILWFFRFFQRGFMVFACKFASGLRGAFWVTDIFIMPTPISMDDNKYGAKKSPVSIPWPLASEHFPQNSKRMAELSC